MGQRTQFYIQFCIGDNKKNLSAMHIQWSWGNFNIIRAKQLLEFISKEIKDENNIESGLYIHSMFLGNSMEKAKEIRQILYSLTQLNLTCGTYCKGIDLVKEELFNKFYDVIHQDSKEDYIEIMQEFDRQIDTDYGIKEMLTTEVDKHYKINPFAQDNNDGIVVIQVNKNGKIKFCFDLLRKQTFEPITAKKYMNEYEYNDLTKVEEQELRQMITYIDSFELLTKNELQEIFNNTYEY